MFYTWEIKTSFKPWAKVKKVHRGIKFNKKDWSDDTVMWTQTDFFMFMNNAAFGKTMENVKKTQRYEVCNNWGKKELFSIRTKLSYNNFFLWKFISHRNKKTQIFMKKPVYLGLSI